MRGKWLPHKQLNSGGKTMQALSKFCCQNKKCPDYGKRGANNLTVCGWYGKNNHIRLLYCRTCKKRFSERKGTPLFGMRLPEEKMISLLDHISESCGVRKTSQAIYFFFSLIYYPAATHFFDFGATTWSLIFNRHSTLPDGMLAIWWWVKGGLVKERWEWGLSMCWPICSRIQQRWAEKARCIFEDAERFAPLR